MPKRDVRDVVHTAYTDHRIQRPGATAPSQDAGLRPWRPPPSQHAKRNSALAWFEWAANTRDPRALEHAAALISDVPPASEDAQVFSAKGAMALQKNLAREAVQWYSRALQLQPQDAETHLRMGRAEHAAGGRDAALKQYNEAIRLDTLLFDAYVHAAQLHRATGDWSAYRKTLESYLRYVPQSLPARQALAASPPSRD